MLSIIVAIAQNNAIGKDNDLLWHLSDDLKRFKAITNGHTVIMGRRTFESLPFRPLKNRRNIVISSSMPAADNYEVVRSIHEAIALCQKEEEVFIIGGSRVYAEALPFADKLYITWVHQDFEADTSFPSLDMKQWNITERSEQMHDEKSGLDYTYITYERIC